MGQMDHFRSKHDASSQLWLHCKIFLKILPSEKGQQVDESKNNCTKKNLFRTNWAILGLKMAHPGLALRIFFFKICRMKGVNRSIKLMLKIFFKKKKNKKLWNNYENLTSTFKCWWSTAAVLVFHEMIALQKI